MQQDSARNLSPGRLREEEETPGRIQLVGRCERTGRGNASQKGTSSEKRGTSEKRPGPRLDPWGRRSECSPGRKEERKRGKELTE